MPVMAKKKPSKPTPARQGESVQAYLDEALVAGLRQFATDTRRTLKAALEMAIEALLKSEGRWPPPEGDQDE